MCYKFDLLLTNIAALTNKSNALDRFGNHRQAIQQYFESFGY
jgi:hypothetical protein